MKEKNKVSICYLWIKVLYCILIWGEKSRSDLILYRSSLPCDSQQCEYVHEGQQLDPCPCSAWDGYPRVYPPLTHRCCPDTPELHQGLGWWYLRDRRLLSGNDSLNLLCVCVYDFFLYSLLHVSLRYVSTVYWQWHFLKVCSGKKKYWSQWVPYIG